MGDYKNRETILKIELTDIAGTKIGVWTINSSLISMDRPVHLQIKDIKDLLFRKSIGAVNFGSYQTFFENILMSLVGDPPYPDSETGNEDYEMGTYFKEGYNPPALKEEPMEDPEPLSFKAGPLGRDHFEKAIVGSASYVATSVHDLKEEWTGTIYEGRQKTLRGEFFRIEASRIAINAAQGYLKYKDFDDKRKMEAFTMISTLLSKKGE